MITQRRALLQSISADPPLDIRNARRIRAVVSREKVFGTGDLQALLAGAETDARLT
jgi:hypothetical protein